MGSRIPRPRVVCPACSNIHEQTGASTVCAICQRREDDLAERQRRLGARCGVSARGDFDAVFRDPSGPFARGFRLAFFREDPLGGDGFERFAGQLRDLYAQRIADADARAARARDDGYRAGYDAGLADGRRESAA